MYGPLGSSHYHGQERLLVVTDYWWLISEIKKFLSEFKVKVYFMYKYVQICITIVFSVFILEM